MPKRGCGIWLVVAVLTSAFLWIGAAAVLLAFTGGWR